jgi:hypothetical protein
MLTRCPACGMGVTHAEWEALPFLRYTPTLELRQHLCGQTVAANRPIPGTLAMHLKGV